MKSFATLFVSALAAVASAAPASSVPSKATEKRAEIDLGAFNGFSFANQDLEYFNAVNGLDLNALVQLSAVNGLDLGGLQALFVEDVVDIGALLQLQQVALLSQLGGLGIFGDLDLASIEINIIDLGILGESVGGFDVSTLVDQALLPQIQNVIQTADLQTVVLNLKK